MTKTLISSFSIFTLFLVTGLISYSLHASEWSEKTHKIIIGDFNGDDIDDMLLQSKDSLYLNGLIRGDGSGTYSDTYHKWSQDYLGINWLESVSEINVGDFNGDNLDDLLIRSRSGTASKILYASLDGRFEGGEYIFNTTHLGVNWSTQNSTLKVGDFNNDSSDDLLIQPLDENQSAYLLTSDSNGQFNSVHQSIPANHLNIDWSSSEHKIIVGDFNGDGNSDLFMQAIRRYVMIPFDGLIIPIYILAEEGHVLLLADSAGKFSSITNQWQNNELAGLNLDDAEYVIQAGNFDGLGGDELILQPVYSGNAHILTFNSNDSFAITQTWVDTGLGANWSNEKSNLLLARVDQNPGVDAIVQPHGTSGTIHISYSDFIGQLTQVITTNLTNDSNVNQQYAVGKVPADFSITPSGQVSYTVPINIPPGIAGMQPELSLNYSSQGGNGMIGVGWSLSGLSAIHRCAKNLAQDGINGTVNIDANDRFCLDGQRLVLVTGSYGAPNSTYRTEVDGFSYITAMGGNSTDGPDWFKVETKEHQTFEYGNTDDSQKKVSTRNGVISWSVNKITDVKDNSIQFEYNNNANGEFYIREITYTHHPSLGTSALRTIRFNYKTEDRPDVIHGYLFGVETRQSKLLSSIETLVGDTEVRKYNFKYGQDSLTNKSRLEELNECDTYGTCVLPSMFEWGDTDSGLSTIKSTSLPVIANYMKNTHFMDINGDGRSDYIYPDGTWKVRLNNNINCEVNIDCNNWITLDTNITASPNTDSSSNFYENTKVSPFYDANKDGIIDFLIQTYSVGKALIYENNRFTTQDIYTDASIFYVSPIDIDRDGDDEFLYKYSNPFWDCCNWGYVITDNGTYSTVNSTHASWSHGDSLTVSHFLLLDHDNDGKVDVLQPNINTGFWDIFIYSETGVTSKATIIPIDGYNQHPKLIDLSGDGLQDLLIKTATGINLYINKGYGSFESPIQIDLSSDAFSNGIQFDYNLDGVPELLNIESGSLKVYTFNGSGFDKSDTGLAVPQTNDGIKLGDIDGDGKLDLFVAENGTWKVLQQKPGIPNQITKFTDGLGAETKITYSALNSDSNLYTKGIGAECNYPLTCLQSAMRVVSSYEASDGLNNFAKYTYKYSDLKAHMRGRGTLGFGSMEVFDHHANLKVVTEYDNTTGFSTGVDGSYNDLYPYAGMATESRTYHVNGANETLVKRTVNSGFQKISTSGNAYFPYNSTTTDYNHELTGSSISTEVKTVAYDSYGNATSVTMTTTDTSGQISNGEVYTKITTNYYHNPYGSNEEYLRYGRLTLAKVESSQTTSRAPPSGTIIPDTSTRYSAFEYNNDLMLSAEIVEPFHPKFRIRKEYTYDIYGNKYTATLNDGSSTSISYSNQDPAISTEPVIHPISTKTTTTTYTGLDSATPEITTSFTVNGVVHSESNVIDARFGVTDSKTGPNGLTTSWQYDGFGRKTGETRHDGGQTTITYDWCVLNCPANGVYTITTQTSEKPDVIAISDKLGREVRTKTYGFNGEIILQDTVYNAIGKIKKTSVPYFNGDTIYFTEYQYDDLGRVTKEISPDLSENLVSYDRLKTTKTNAKTQQSIEFKNTRGKIIKVIDDDSERNLYYYDVSDNLVVTQDAHDNEIRITYDRLNRKVTMNDPDMGDWSYEYDAQGKLRKQTDAKGQITQSTYDLLGRMVTRSSTNEYSTWYYDKDQNGVLVPKAVGKLVYSSNANQTQKIEYDNLGRIKKTITTIDGVAYEQEVVYDTTVSYTRKEETKYPNGFAVKYSYKNNGYLYQLRNAANNDLLWELKSLDARGKMDMEELANSAITTARSYEADTGFLESIASYTTLDDFQLNQYHFDVLGNLESRTDLLNNYSESFLYDNLNRLETAQLTGEAAKTYVYDEIGNLINKPDVSTSNYSYGQVDGSGNITKPHAVTSIGSTSYTYDANGNMETGDGRTISYSSFNKPLQISRGSTTNNYYYDADRNRIKKISNKDSSVTSTIYIGKGYEKITKPSGVIEHKYYIGAGSNKIAYTKRSNNTEELNYLLTDHLGSTDVIVGYQGSTLVVKERQSFEAWGARRNINWTDTNNFGLDINSTITTRGFTGHEMDDEIGLINMNARLYDPKIGRFLTPDTFVQMPYSTQGLNRYTYVNNNPLSLTDPSGHFFKKLFKKIKKFFRKYVAAIVAIIISVYLPNAIFWYLAETTAMSVAAATIASGVLTGAAIGASTGILTGGGIKGAIKGAFMGGISGGLGGGGASFGAMATNAIVGGLVSKANGGKFSNGFLSSAFASFVGYSTRAGNFLHARSIQGKFLVNTISAGIKAEIGGGKFKNGARTFAFQTMIIEGPNIFNQLFGPSANYQFTDSEGYELTKVQGGTAEERLAVEESTKRILGTKRGRELAKSLSVTINLNNSGKNQWNPDTETIWIDQHNAPKVWVYDSLNNSIQKVQPSLDRLLSHEFGHAFGGAKDDGFLWLNNIKANENPIMEELGELPRIWY